MLSELKIRLVDEVGRITIGLEKEVTLLLIALLAQGHVLIEGVPGVAKTLLARTFSRCLSLRFKRVQFTPDMLPLDVLGGFVFNVKEREFEFRDGPIFTNILLADEINRAPPKVQSALLEAMQERQVTVEGYTKPLPEPFMVLATQNPLEFEGVYPLPEGQLDRFMIKLEIGYPSLEDEVKILNKNLNLLSPEDVNPILNAEDVLNLQKSLEKVKVSGEILDYVARLARAIREKPEVELGASPRAMVHLIKAARARAALEGRPYVIPDDVKAMAVYVLSHRIRVSRTLAFKGEGKAPPILLKEVLNEVVPPR